MLDAWEDVEDQPEPWAPTGANTLTLGNKSADISNSNSLRSVPLTASGKPEMSRVSLKLPVERYLPPPGPYYDQFSLALILDIRFANDRCWVCWRSRRKCTMLAACTKTCRVCHTPDHPGAVSNVSNFHALYQIAVRTLATPAGAIAKRKC